MSGHPSARAFAARTGWCLVGLLLVLIDASGVGAQHDIRDVVARHLAWRGGATALSRMQDLHRVGTIEGAGLAGTVTQDDARAGWYRRHERLGPAATTDIVGPAGAWIVNMSGQVEPMSAAQAEAVRQESILTFGRHLVESALSALTDLGTEEKDGRTWRVARFTFPNRDAFDLFLDPADGSCTWIREMQDRDVLWTRLDDWRIVSGVRLPFERRSIDDANSRRNFTTRWSEVKVNAGIERAAFDRPRPRQATVRIDGGRSTGWMPMELQAGRHIVIKGSVQGRDVDLLLDTGAQVSVLSAAFAGTLGLTSTGQIDIEGISSSQAASLATGIAMRIGPLALSDLTVVVADLRDVEQAFGRTVPMVLGKEIFNVTVVDIDYPNARIAFHDPASYRPDRGARVVPLPPRGTGGRLLDVVVEGLPPAPFVLDTGSGSALTLFKTFVDEHRLLERRARRSEAMLRGVGGASVADLITLRSISIAGLELHDVPAEVHRVDRGAFNTRQLAGNLGAGVLNRFRVTLDYPRDRMYLTPGARWKEAFCKNRVGLHAEFRGTFLEVVFVAPGSPATASGWTTGDRIAAIDGVPIDDRYRTRLAEWACKPPGSRITFTDPAGVSRTLVLRDYY